MGTLLIDAGNSRLKWSLCERGQFLQSGVFDYDWSALPAQFDQQWGALRREATVDKLELSNVAGDSLASPLCEWWQGAGLQEKALQETSSLTIETVVAQSQAFGVQCAYTQPAQLGADRWAALVAARHHITGASCIIDCGTALTIDVLNAEGVHIGGLIAPGLSMMRSSLLSNTANIDINDAASQSVFSVQNTAGAVQAGIMAATLGAVQQALEQCREQGLQEPICVVTGGDAQLLMQSLPNASVHDAEWVLKGLAIIAGCHE